MRKTVYATAILIIIFLAQSIAVEANPYNFISPYLFIESPDASPWVIYQTNNIPIEVEVLPAPNTNLVEISYILDGSPNVKLGITRFETSLTCFGKGTLENLTDGYHKVTAVSTDSKGNVLSHSTTFLVNTTLSFPTLLLSPNNITYYSKEIPLTYTIDDPKYTVYYRLDDRSKQTTLTSNTTLTGLSEGQHTITAVATDHKTGTGLYSKQTAHFTIDTTSPIPTATPYLPPNRNAPHLDPTFYLLPISIILAIIITAIVIYRRRKISK
jgi:hypothetical protein